MSGNYSTQAEKVDIIELLSRYAFAVDRANFSEFENIFTPDGRFNLVGMATGDKTFTVSEFAAFLTPIIGGCDFVMHNVTNTVIDIQGASATAESYLSVIYGVKAGVSIPQFGVSNAARTEVILGSVYSDKLRKTPYGWRLAERTVRVLYQREARLPGPQ